MKIAQFVKTTQLQENDDLLRAILQEQLVQWLYINSFEPWALIVKTNANE